MATAISRNKGVTPALARVVETLDAERLAIGKAMGVEVPSIRDFYRTSYAAFGKNLHEQLQNVKAYIGIKGPTSLNTRYIFEDLPPGSSPCQPSARPWACPRRP